MADGVLNAKVELKAQALASTILTVYTFGVPDELGLLHNPPKVVPTEPVFTSVIVGVPIAFTGVMVTAPLQFPKHVGLVNTELDCKAGGLASCTVFVTVQRLSSCATMVKIPVPVTLRLMGESPVPNGCQVAVTAPCAFVKVVAMLPLEAPKHFGLVAVSVAFRGPAGPEITNGTTVEQPFASVMFTE
jgi:hypothetical protein